MTSTVNCFSHHDHNHNINVSQKSMVYGSLITEKGTWPQLITYCALCSTHGEENNPGRGSTFRPALRAYLSALSALARNSLRELFSFFRRTGNDRDFVSVALPRSPLCRMEGRKEGPPVRVCPSVAARLCTYPSGNSFVLAERERREKKKKKGQSDDIL